MRDLNASTLLAAMLVAQATRRSGIFEVNGEGTRTLVYFRDGKIVFAEQGTLGDTLGRVLVREGRITIDQYTTAIRRMTQQLVESEQMRFGEVLVELGFLSVEQLQEALVVQVRHKTIRSLMYEAPEWSFRDATERLGVAHYPMSVEPIVLGATKLFEQERVERILDLEQDRYPRLLAGVPAIASLFDMSGVEQRFLALVDGARSTHVLVGAKHPGVGDAGAVLAALVLTGAAELCPHPTAAPAPVRRATPVAAAAVPTPASPPAPARRPAEPQQPTIARRPEPPPVSVSTPFESAIMPLLADPHAARLVAEGAFQKARMHLRHDDVGKALFELRRAAQLCPTSIEFTLHLMWAESVTCADDELPARRAALKQFAAKAEKQDPNLAFGFFVRGQIALLDGESPKTAIRLFRHALKLDPDLAEAKRHLEALKTSAGADPAEPSVLHAVVPKVQQAVQALRTKLELPNRGAQPKNLATQGPKTVDAAHRTTLPEVAPTPRVVAAVAVAAPPASTAKPAPHRDDGCAAVIAAVPPARRASHTMLAALASLVVVAVAAAVTVFVSTSPHADHGPSPVPGPSARGATTASATPPSVPPSVPPSASVATGTPAGAVGASPSASAAAAPKPPAAVTSDADAAATSPPVTTGTVTARSGSGRRIFMDGRVIGEGPGPLVTPCGGHRMKVGSAGQERSVTVPCGGTVALEP